VAGPRVLGGGAEGLGGRAEDLGGKAEETSWRVWGVDSWQRMRGIFLGTPGTPR